MKRCLYLMSVLTMIWSLAACGKAVSSHQDIFETEEEHRGFVDENGTIEIVRGDEISVQMDKINVGFAKVQISVNGRLPRQSPFTVHLRRPTGII